MNWSNTAYTGLEPAAIAAGLAQIPLPTPSGPIAEAYSVAYGNNQWVATGKGTAASNTILYSGDGSNWSNTSQGGFDLNFGYGVTYANNEWVAVGKATSQVSTIQTSTDGISWTVPLPNFSPTQIPGCKLWFDANDSATIFSDTAGTTPITPGGSVARFNDKSGNNNYLQQVTAGSRPVYQTTPGGYNGIYFSSPPTQMTTVNNSPVTGNSARTIFLIQQAPSGVTRVGTGPHTSLPTTTSPPNTFGIDNNTGGVLACPYVYAAADNTIAVSLTALAEIWVYYDPSVTQIGGNYNFLAAQSKSTTPSPYLNTSASPWYFGVRPDTGGSYNSYICEFILYDSVLTTNQRQQVEAYLAWKWGLQASLPSDNPYNKLYEPGGFNAGTGYAVSFKQWRGSSN